MLVKTVITLVQPIAMPIGDDASPLICFLDTIDATEPFDDFELLFSVKAVANVVEVDIALLHRIRIFHKN